MTNSLSTQTSPYLLQHAENPVDWHPWGETALALARELDKPILLSVGYSACHWCHVMERESFEDETLAAQMNELFVCIKVDREERPDLDKIYQTAHQMLTRRAGGWPLTVALTPTGHAPFFAGTYFPPAPRMGMPGFGQVLADVAQHYRRHRAQMGDHHQAFERAMAELNPSPSAANLPASTTEKALEKAVEELANQFDWQFGGFGNAPKFPHPTQLELLLRHGAQNRAGEPAKSARFFDLSLRKMAEGGLYDQIGGGFYRYSVDRQWRIPHFEKMLYDNAQLLALYSDAAQYWDAPFYRAIVEQTGAWVIREMQQEHGGYASTLDADSEGVEGKYYVWSETQLRALLNAAEYQAIEECYDLAGEPNFEGNWHFAINPNTNPNLEARSDVRNADRAGALQTAKAKLLSARERRIRPALDDKILTAWNGMMLKGMARAARMLEREDFAQSAAAALDFVRDNLWRDGRLLATSRNGEARLNGYLDDYAFLAEGIIELLRTKWRSGDLRFAVQLCDAMLEGFEDRESGGFFFTSHDHEKLLHRPKTGIDDAIPSGNGAAARTLYQLGHLLGDSRYLQSAEKTLQLFAPALDKAPSVHGLLSMALQARERANKIVIIRGTDEEAAAWQAVCRRRYHPENMVFAIPPNATDLPPALAQRKAQSKTTAYLCQGTTCSAPIHSLDELEAQLAQDLSVPADDSGHS